MDEFAKLTELTTDPLAELLKEAVELARRAGELTLGYFRSNALTIELKSDGSPVTQADRQAERLIRDELAFHHPGDGILGEEEDEKPSETGRRWIVDPIDGTLAFTHGVGLFSNLLALEDEYGSAVGVINVPALGETIYAARGLGCYCNGVPAKVSERGELAGSYLTTSSFGEWDETALLGVRRAGIELRTWGDGYGYALVRDREDGRDGRFLGQALRHRSDARDHLGGRRVLHRLARCAGVRRRIGPRDQRAHPLGSVEAVGASAGR